jgi:hypothetical protein
MKQAIVDKWCQVAGKIYQIGVGFLFQSGNLAQQNCPTKRAACT